MSSTIVQTKSKSRAKTTKPVPNNITVVIEETVVPVEPATPKKRPSKKKPVKVVPPLPEQVLPPQPIANVILHLKCSMQDLSEHNVKISQLVTDPLIYNPSVPPSILSYNSVGKSGFSVYDNLMQSKAALSTSNTLPSENSYSSEIASEPPHYAYAEFETEKLITSSGITNICQMCNEKMKEQDEDISEEDDAKITTKDINGKLKTLKLQLYKNAVQDKKAACFWCTYEYDNPPCYIPKYEMDGQLYGYGSFCRPECGVAYLMKENIDDSTKFERYHLLNQIYSKIYNFKHNIKPAPNPHYLLEKFYGNLTIQEYRKLLKTEHLMLIIDKPMTRILPELHEDADEFSINTCGGKSATTSQGGIYKVKRQSEKKDGPTKSTIMKETFSK